MKRFIYFTAIIVLLLCYNTYAQTLYSWGSNSDGQLGDGTTKSRTSQAQIGTDSYWASVSCGQSHTLAIKNDGTLWAWGNNEYGQLGDGTNTKRTLPVQIGIDTNWAKIVCGGMHTMAIKTDGTLWAWGWNDYGQLGDSARTYRTSPFQIGNDSNWSSVSCGHVHTLAIKTDGSLWAWGWNRFGQLGDGTTTIRISPIQVGTGGNWATVSCGHDHTMAIKSDGTLWAWGINTNGQLGVGFTSEISFPSQIGTDKNWESVNSSYYYTMATKSDGTLWAWGSNEYGKLGDGTTTDRHSPIQIGTETNWATVACGYYHTMAFKTDGTLWTWGYNANGQLGDGTTTNRISPVQIGSSVKWHKVSAGSNYSVGLNFSTALITPANNIKNISIVPSFEISDFKNATDYTFQISKTSDFISPVLNATSNSTTYRVNPGILDFGTTYYWRARATVNGEIWEWSSAWSFTTAETIQTSPSNNAINQGLTTILRWENIGTSSAYDLQISTVSNFSSILTEVAGIETNSYSIPFSILNIGAKYYWRVRVIENAWRSSWTSPYTFSTITTIQTFPENNSINQSLTPVLQWESVDFADSYDLQISQASNFSSILKELTGIESNTYTIPEGALNYGVKFFWRLRVNNGDWSSSWTNPYSFTTQSVNSNFNMFSYQGVLTDNDGNFLNGNYTLTVKIYDSPTSPAYLWTESHQLAITKGIFNIILGSVNPIDLPFNTSYWLGISVNGGSELTPRTQMVGNIYKK